MRAKEKQNLKNAISLSNDQKKHDWKTERKFRQMLIVNRINYVWQKPYASDERFCVVDFFLPDLNIVIELDGSTHKRLKDLKRTRWIYKMGVSKVIRFKNNDVNTNLKSVESMVKELFAK